MCYSPTLRSLPGKLGDPFVSFGLPSVLGSTSFHVRIRMALAGGHKSWKNNLTLTLSESSTGRVKSGRWVRDKLPTGKAMRNQFLVQSPKVEGSSQSVASGTFHVEADTIIARREIPTCPRISTYALHLELWRHSRMQDDDDDDRRRWSAPPVR